MVPFFSSTWNHNNIIVIFLKKPSNTGTRNSSITYFILVFIILYSIYTGTYLLEPVKNYGK
jgi:hypothetical protein